jgi:hypothetical protein
MYFYEVDQNDPLLVTMTPRKSLPAATIHYVMRKVGKFVLPFPYFYVLSRNVFSLPCHFVLFPPGDSYGQAGHFCPPREIRSFRRQSIGSPSLRHLTKQGRDVLYEVQMLFVATSITSLIQNCDTTICALVVSTLVPSQSLLFARFALWVIWAVTPFFSPHFNLPGKWFHLRDRKSRFTFTLFHFPFLTSSRKDLNFSFPPIAKERMRRLAAAVNFFKEADGDENDLICTF